MSRALMPRFVPSLLLAAATLLAAGLAAPGAAAQGATAQGATPQGATPGPARQGTAAPTTEGRRYAPGAFDTVVITGAASVRLVQGAEDSVFVEGDAEAQNAVRLDLEDRQLVIHQNGAWKFWRGKTVQIVVTARDLKRLEISGSADVVASEALRLKQVQIRIAGAGAVRMDRLKADKLEFNVSGSGTGQLSGAVDELAVRISGRGAYLGENLASQNASVAVSGSGEVRVWATKALAAQVSGVASIDYWGAATVAKSSSGLATWNDHGDKRVP